MTDTPEDDHLRVSDEVAERLANLFTPKQPAAAEPDPAAAERDVLARLWPDEPDEPEPPAEPAAGSAEAIDEGVDDLVDDATEQAVAELAAVLPPEEAVDGEAITTGQRFPDLTEDADLDSALEAVLLVVDAPVETEVLAGAVDQPVARTRTALRRLQARYTDAGSGVDLRRVGVGWRFFTRDRFAPVVEKLLLDGQRAKLTRAALETLAVIAYRQPVTRSRVAAVRGVNVDGVIRTLVVRGLIEESGTDSETGGILYVTTELFLERLGLSSLEDLPAIAPLLPEVEAIDDVS